MEKIQKPCHMKALSDENHSTEQLGPVLQEHNAQPVPTHLLPPNTTEPSTNDKTKESDLRFNPATGEQSLILDLGKAALNSRGKKAKIRTRGTTSALQNKITRSKGPSSIPGT
eukprot:TRINITY_DN13777_c1_g1_i1.p2 TRINITY_DN13777_c1_g1~~TRINITY_DN13777_c1_g1_i1.p2  ORF type:complete len:113 (-),score=13.06 TRINITY_DN13777_c1_g1_i1:375-713(-)